MLVLIIVIAALVVLYKLWMWVDSVLQEYNKKSLVIKEPESEEEKKAVSTALSLYRADKMSVLLCRPEPEKEQKHDKILIIFFLLVLFVVLMAIGLIIVII